MSDTSLVVLLLGLIALYVWLEFVHTPKCEDCKNDGGGFGSIGGAYGQGG